ncbi:hypothetical protein FIBSPDRAFT_146332 [Athelia psychrophila]|uniref:Uncharacterized protein n=1 Tax=Athelia psychrophila TaxID=1759441 RepID=A0A166T585_9AGAM|nr:hypothetical protein FIBSPDRAFT_146332 [Fibularhizoctonia sp. CBS 109695]
MFQIHDNLLTSGLLCPIVQSFPVCYLWHISMPEPRPSHQKEADSHSRPHFEPKEISLNLRSYRYSMLLRS